MEKLEPSYILGTVEWYSHLGKYVDTKACMCMWMFTAVSFIKSTHYMIAFLWISRIGKSTDIKEVD